MLRRYLILARGGNDVMYVEFLLGLWGLGLNHLPWRMSGWNAALAAVRCPVCPPVCFGLRVTKCRHICPAADRMEKDETFPCLFPSKSNF